MRDFGTEEEVVGDAMITAGIDCGAKNTKTVIMQDGNIIGKGMVLTGFDPGQGRRRLAGHGRATSRHRPRRTFNGFAEPVRAKSAVEIADTAVNDIKAMARGAFYFFPKARTVADVGAEEGRAARLDEKGNPVDFAVNEKMRGRRRRLHRGHGAGARGRPSSRWGRSACSPTGRSP
ncbi:MAG: hypothetical protein MZV70_12080 [Desulfobacterales bacterium]|nr:hypothetical protein [Desulfobacterales bacterium]